MATFEEMLRRAESAGYPVSENEIIISDQKAMPPFPFIIYEKTEKFTGYDMAVRIKTTETNMYFITSRRMNDTDRAKIAAFEETMFFDTDYVKRQQYIRSENITQTEYQFITTEKLRKG